METVTNIFKGIGIAVALVVALVLLSCLMMGAMSPILIADCHAQTQDIGEGRWLYFGGCQVNIDGKWIPLKNYRYFEQD